MSGKIFQGGVPTGPDVTKLMELDPQPGMSLSYEEIERAIGLRYGDARFNTVIESFRKRLFRERLLQTKRAGGAIHFLTNDGAHDEGRARVKKIGRQAGRHRIKVDAIDARDLTSERQTVHALLRREAQAMLDAAQQAEKALARPKLSAVASTRPLAS